MGTEGATSVRPVFSYHTLQLTMLVLVFERAPHDVLLWHLNALLIINCKRR